MNKQRKARLGGRNAAITWLVDPVVDVPDSARPMLYAALLSAPAVIVMGALTAISIVLAAALRTGERAFWVLLAVELTFLLLRLRATHRIRRHYRVGTMPSIERSVTLSLAWCALQGLSAFAIALSGDVVMIVVATAFILGLVAPICARNYAAPRLAVSMVMLADLPFKLGLALSGEALFWMLIPMTIPLLFGVRALLGNFGQMLGLSLEAAEHNRQLADHDSLTGLGNRRGLEEALTQMTAAANRPVALLCIDLDRFKPVNDRYGHAAGDAVLVAVAARMRHVAPEAALLARLGGDEFVIAVRDLSPDDARAFAERLAHALSARRYRIDDTVRVQIGASIGYACFPEDAASVDELRRRADAALYASKRSGMTRRYDESVATIAAAA